MKTYIGTIGAVASFIIGGVIGWVYPPRGHFQIQDRQVMAGEWSISIQTQPCDKGELGVHMPERDGDVITVYCKTMPVAAR